MPKVKDLLLRLQLEVEKDERVGDYTILMDCTNVPKFEVHHHSKVVRLGHLSAPNGAESLNSAKGGMKL